MGVGVSVTVLFVSVEKVRVDVLFTPVILHQRFYFFIRIVYFILFFPLNGYLHSLLELLL